MDKYKYQFAGFVIGVTGIMQGIAWYSGHNGQVFAFTSLVIGGITGAILGIDFGIKKNKT